LRRVEAIKGCVLDQDDTLADLIGARSYKPHPEAGYTTDNLLLSLTVECLAMREETIYVPPGVHRLAGASGQTTQAERGCATPGEYAFRERRAHTPRPDATGLPPGVAILYEHPPRVRTAQRAGWLDVRALLLPRGRAGARPSRGHTRSPM